MKLSKDLLAIADLKAEADKFSSPINEGLGKTVARLVTGKTVGARANQEKERSFNALRAGDTKAAEKHMQRHLSFEKLMGKNLNYKAIRALADDELNKMYKSIGGASYADAQYVKLRQGLKDEIVRRKSLKEDESFDQHTMLPEAVEQINLLLAEGKISGFKPPFKYDTKSGILNSVIDSAGKNVCDAKTRMIARNIVDALNSFTKPTVTEAVKAMTAWDVLNNIAETKHGEYGFATLSDSEASMYINMRAANKLASDESGEDSFMQLSEKEMKNIVNANPDLLKGMARKMNTKSVVSSAVYIPTSDDKRLEKQIKTAMDKGDDYTAKSYAKMAETSDGRKYLNSIIKQLMKPLKESSEIKRGDELEIGDGVVITGNVLDRGEEGEIVEFGKDKKFVTVKLNDSGKTKSFHSSDVTDLKAKYSDDDQDEDEDEDEDIFFVTIIDDEGDNTDGFIGKVVKIDGKWKELPFEGKPHHRWGQRYMGYLSKREIMDYIKKDFGRDYIVHGPFATSADARDHFQDNGADINYASVRESVSDDLLEYFTKAYRKMIDMQAYTLDGKKDIDAMYNSIRGALKKEDLKDFRKQYAYYSARYPDISDEYYDMVFSAAKVNTFGELLSKVKLTEATILEDASAMITDGKDRRKFKALMNMRDERLAKAKISKDLVKSGHEQMAKKYSDEANEILDKYRVNESQSLGGALRRSLSKPEAGSKLDQKIKAHNFAIKSGKNGVFTTAPDGFKFKKDGSLVLENVSENPTRKQQLEDMLSALKLRAKETSLSDAQQYRIADRIERIEGELERLGSVSEAITYTDIEDWKKAVKNSYPQQATKMRFNGRMEGGKMTVSAEVPGIDRCFGVWDQEEEKGEVLSEMNLLRSLSRLNITEADDEPTESDEPKKPKIIGKAGEFIVELDEEDEYVWLKNTLGEILTGMPLVIWKELKRQ